MGALTSKPYAFTSRPWELKSVESIDIFDSYMSSVRYDYRGNTVLRILPVLNVNLNQEWITDKVRFFYDALDNQRLASPWIRYSLLVNYLHNNFSYPFEQFVESFSLPVGWAYTLELVRNTFSNIFKFYSSELINFCGFLSPFTDIKSLIYFKYFLNLTGNNNSLFSPLSSSLQICENDNRSSFIFDQKAFFSKNQIVLVGFNPRYESPLLNIRIREAFLNRNFKIYSIGSNFITNYLIQNMGSTLSVFMKFANARNFLSLKWIEKTSAILIGSSVLKFKKFSSLISNFFKHEDVFVFMPYASSTAHFEFSSYPSQFINIENSLNIFYNLSNDNLQINTGALEKFDNFLLSNFKYSFVDAIFHIYQGSHGDLGALNAHLALPATTHTESTINFFNSFGKFKTSHLVFPPVLPLIRTNISILKALSPLVRLNLNSLVLTIANFNESEASLYSTDLAVIPSFNSNQIAAFSYYPFVLLQSFINEFYLTDAITRSSKNLTAVTLNSKLKSINFI